MSGVIDEIVVAIHGYLAGEGFQTQRTSQRALTLPEDGSENAPRLRLLIMDEEVVVWLAETKINVAEVSLADPMLLEILRSYCAAWTNTVARPSLRFDYSEFRGLAKGFLDGRISRGSGTAPGLNRRVRLPSGFLRPGED